jgi:hypothetical protein
MSKSHKAGGFRICATKAGAQVTILHIKDMEDAAEAKEAALSLIAQGADEAGLVQEVKEKNICVRGRGFDQTKSRRTPFSQISSRIGRACSAALPTR